MRVGDACGHPKEKNMKRLILLSAALMMVPGAAGPAKSAPPSAPPLSARPNSERDQVRQQLESLQRDVASLRQQLSKGGELTTLQALVKRQQEQLTALQAQLTELKEELVRLRENRQELLGRWKVVSFTENGQRKEAVISRLVFARTTVTFQYGDGRGEQTFPCNTDPTGQPKTMDVYGSGVIPVLGIYALDQETLTICMDRGNATRPAALTSAPGGNTMLLILERERPDAPGAPAARSAPADRGGP